MFEHIVGQEQAKLAIQDWYLHESGPILIWGPSGYGKSTFITALGAKVIDTTQLRSDRISSIIKPIKAAEDGDILFFDEIHSLQPKVLEGLYQIMEKGSYYEADIGLELPLPKVRMAFATNFINKLPDAFKNRCKIIELQTYTSEELEEIIYKRHPEIDKAALKTIVRASKGVPRTALSLARSVIAGAKTEKIKIINSDNVNSLLASRFNINPATGLSEKEFGIVQQVCDKGHISTTAVANLLKMSIKDALTQYIQPLQASDWLAITSRGVVPGFKAYENYRIFVKKIK